MEEKGLTYVFSERFKLLRQMYGASVKDLSTMLGNQPTNVAALENHKIGASARVIILTSKIFGVSIDWMLGISHEPYTEETVVAAEQYLSDKIIRLARINKGYEQYIILRKGSMIQDWQRLDLDNRFNMVFLNQFMVSQMIQEIDPNLKSTKKTRKTYKVNVFRSYSLIVPLAEKKHELITNMQKVASNPESPVWDLKKLIRQTIKKEPSAKTEEFSQGSLFDI